MSIVTYNNRSIANISAVPGAAKALTHIKTLTASSSSTLSFVDGSSDVVLDSTYPIYVFKFINIHPATDNVKFGINFSTDSGSNYNTTKTTIQAPRAIHSEGGADGQVGSNTAEDLAQGTGDHYLHPNLGSGNDECSSGYLHLFNPSSTTFVKHFIASYQGYSSDNYSQVYHTAGYNNTTSAIDAVRFQFTSGNIDAGTIKLYGLKDS